MRLVIVILVGLSVWLLAERHRLSEGIANFEAKADRLQREKTDLEKKLAVALAPRPAAPGYAPVQPQPQQKTWLQERIEQGSRLLDAPQPYHPSYPPAYPSNRPVTPGSRLIR